MNELCYLLTTVLEIQRECAAPNWDGHGAGPLSHAVAKNTVCLLCDLARRGLPLPEPESLAPVPQDMLFMEWPDRGVIIGLGKDNEMTYVIEGRGSRKSLTGTAPIVDKNGIVRVPKFIVKILAQRNDATEGWLRGIWIPIVASLVAVSITIIVRSIIT